MSTHEEEMFYDAEGRRRWKALVAASGGQERLDQIAAEVYSKAFNSQLNHQERNMELSLHTGAVGSEQRINVEWFDHNNIRQTTVVLISFDAKDKPRTLRIELNGVTVAQVLPK